MKLMFAMNTLAAAGALSLVAGAASAATELIHFDELASNNSSNEVYTTLDGHFQLEGQPDGQEINFNSSTQCAESVNGGNGNCVLEFQADFFNLTHDDNDDDLVYDDDFTMESFYFFFAGNGPTQYLDIYAYNDVSVADADDTLPFEDFLATLRIEDDVTATSGTLLDNSGQEYGSYTITREDGGEVGDVVNNGIGYFISFTGLDDIGLFRFDAGATAQIRMDCIVVSGENFTPWPGDEETPSNNFASYSTGCGVSPDPIPLPAAGWLLIAGIGGLAAMKRRKS